MSKSIEQIQEVMKRFALIALEYAGLNYQTWERTKRFFKTWGFNKTKQIEFIQDFSSWLNDGCSPSQACHSVIGAGKGDKRLKNEVNAAQSIYDALKRGQSISEGMVDWFSPEVVMLFEAGQQAGSDSLTRVVNEYLRQEEEVKKAKVEFWKPVKQPLVYFGIAFSFMLVMGTFLLPEFLSIMPPEKLTSAIKIVMATSAWFTGNFLLVVVAVLMSFVALRHFMETNASKFRLQMDSYFPLNIYKNFAAMRTLKTLGILVETRYNLNRAALELKKHSSGYMTYHLNHVIRETQFGESDLGNALDSGLLSKRLMFRLRNAANSPDQERKKSAISIAADRSGGEAVRTLFGTRQLVAASLWIATVVTMLLAVSSFMGVISSLFNMSYQ